MAIVYANVGEEVALKASLNHTAATNLVLRLYSNDVTPGETDTAGTYTELTTSGYAAITLTGSSWTVTPGAPTSASYAQQTFQLNGSATAYGYYLTYATSGTLFAAERFSSAPYTVGAGGGTVRVTPVVTLE